MDQYTGTEIKFSFLFFAFHEKEKRKWKGNLITEVTCGTKELPV